jgi:hypothetical protein
MRNLPDPREPVIFTPFSQAKSFDDMVNRLHGKDDAAYPRRCGFESQPDDVWGGRVWGGTARWQWTGQRLAKIWFVPVDVPDEEGNWGEFAERIEEIDAGFKELGFDVEIYQDGSSKELIEMLQGRVDYRLIAAHGKIGPEGIRAADRHVSWVEIEDSIGATGLLHMVSCWSFRSIYCEDEDNVYSFHHGLAGAGCSAAVLCNGVGHYFRGKIKTDRVFEIERLLWVLERCLEVGLRRAIEDYRDRYESMLGKHDASILVDHEVAVGDPDWGITG